MDEAEAGPSGRTPELAPLDTRKHVSFFLRCLRLLPAPYTSADDQRMTLAYFALAALDLLSSVDRIPEQERAELIDWVYEQQCLPQGGFRGSPSSAHKPCEANIAMTYSAVLTLAILRDDFSRVDQPALRRFVGRLQDAENGGSRAVEPLSPETQSSPDGQDPDPRFTYCAAVLWHLCGSVTSADNVTSGSLDLHKARQSIVQSQRYDGGFGATPDQESHSGMTYCSVASLALLDPAQRDQSWLPRRDETVSWLIHRQVQHEPPTESQDDDQSIDDAQRGGGFQGRPSKLPPDVCYSFWNGAALHILNSHHLIDPMQDAALILSAQSHVGGIAKVPGDHPDLLHSYLGLAALALHQQSNPSLPFPLQSLDPLLNCTVDTAQWLHTHLHNS